MRTTTMEAPVNFPLPESWPEPRPRCKVCAALAAERVEAWRTGDHSKVSDCNIEIRAHGAPHRRRRP